MRRVVVVGVCSALPLSLTAPLSAQEPSPVLNAPEAPSRGAGDVSPEVAQKAASIARQTMSPFCPGRTLSDCPSPSATEWRRDIRQMVASGMSPAEIQAELEKRVGDNLSGSPNPETSWAVPLFLAAAAALTLFFIFVRLRPKKKQPIDAPRRVRSSHAPQQGEAGTHAEPSDRRPRSSTSSAQPGPSVDDARLQRELESEDV